MCALRRMFPDRGITLNSVYAMEKESHHLEVSLPEYLSVLDVSGTLENIKLQVYHTSQNSLFSIEKTWKLT